MEKFRNTLVSVRDLLVSAGPFLLLAVALLVAAYFIVDPTPPRKVVIATGPEDSDYAAFGARYKTMLARRGITAELRSTLGSAENAALLRDPKSHVDIAFIRSGTIRRSEARDQGLTSLGSLFYEPVWLFLRDGYRIESVADLRGARLNVGPDGSGVPALAKNLLALNHLEPGDLRLGDLENTPAVMALLESKIDALMITSASDGLLVQMLLRTPGVQLFDFEQAEAYSRRVRGLTHVTLPRGVVDLAQDMPAHDVQLVAPTSTLVARDGIHPALLELIVQVASRVHGSADWFSRAGQFPTAQSAEIPVANEAARYYQSGPPLMQRYLPFWLANLIERMWIVFLSLGALLIPLSRVVPPIYQWRVRSRVYRWYGELRAVEREAALPATGRSPVETRMLLRRLHDIEERVNDINVPLSYADEVYFLRGHIELVRERLLAERASESIEPA